MMNSFNNLQKRLPNSSAEQEAHSKALRFLSLTVFLLMAAPLMNVYVGPVPIYAIDFLALFTWVYANRISSSRRYPLRGFVVFILIAVLLSELVAGIQLGTLLQPAYLIARTLLAISLFFSAPKIIRNKSDLETVLKGGLLGAVITAALMIASSLPQMQSLVARYVFSLSFLNPSSDDIARQYLYAGMAMRGQSLVGISILSGAWLNTIWPLLFLLRANEKQGWGWRVLLIGALVLVPLAVVMSYSRGMIMGLILIVIVVLLLNSNKVRQPVVIGAVISILIFSWVGWGSQYFKFEWLQNKTEYQFAHVDQEDNMTHRIYAYSDPFMLIQENPMFIFLGEGLARYKIAGASSAVSRLASHAAFATATYGYGMPAAFAYVFLLMGTIRITLGYAWRSKNDFLKLFSRASLAGLFGLTVYFIQEPVLSEPRGVMLLFFVFGLAAAQSNFADSPKLVESEQSPLWVENSVGTGG